VENPVTPSDYMMEALINLHKARIAMQGREVRHREAAFYAIAEAEKDIAHVLGMLVEEVPCHSGLGN